MAKGQEIVLGLEPRGRQEEGQIIDTSSPGMLVEVVPNSALISGRPKFRARSQAAGALGPIIVLLADRLQGKLGVGAGGAVISSGGVSVTGPAKPGDAYAANTQCFVYYPMAGEELNLLVGDVPGTGDVITQGDLYGVNNNGKLIKDSSYTSAPFQAMETTPALTGDAMIWFKFLGQQAG